MGESHGDRHAALALILAADPQSAQRGRGSRRADRSGQSRLQRRRATSICGSAGEDGKELARANPLRVVASAPLRRYWGDLHGQSGETIGMGSGGRLFPLRARQGVRRHRRPSGQRLPDHRRVLARAQSPDGVVRQAGPFRLRARLRMVGQHRHGRRPQRVLSPRGPPDPSLVAHSGRGPDLDPRAPHRRGPVRRTCRRGRRGDRACRRALRGYPCGA